VVVNDHLAVLGRDYRTIQDAHIVPNPHIAADHCSGRDHGGRGYLRAMAAVFNNHGTHRTHPRE